MFQRFFEDTIMSRFIKNLLATTKIPMYTCVSDGDIIVANGKYIYKDYVIKCVSTGRLFVDDSDILVPSDTLYPSLILYPGTGEPPAKFRVLELYSSDNIKYNYTYHSKFSYYDSDTHKHLGEYLRYLKAIKSLDLFPFYNCYNYHIVDNVSLSYKNEDNKTYSIATDNRYKVVAVPIKFFRQYTVAIDCNTEVLCRCVIYSDSGMVIDGNDTSKYLSDKLETSFLAKSKTEFDSPFVYSVSPSDESLVQHQKNLYLLIQLPKDNDSAIVVLEGDYTNYESHTTVKTTGDDVTWSDEAQSAIVVKEGVGSESKPERFSPNISLLQFNCKTSFAFSDRLLEYLLLSVIHPDDELYLNIARVQQALITIDEKYKNLTGEYRYGYAEYMATRGSNYGLWDDKLTEVIRMFIEDCRDKHSLRDMCLHVNKDLEKMLVIEGGRY